MAGVPAAGEHTLPITPKDWAHVAGRMDMFKVASSVFCGENMDYRGILMLLWDTDNVDPTHQGRILKEIHMFFWDSNLLTYSFPL